MTFYGIIFYLLGIVLVVSTGLAVSRSRLVHAVAYLVISFFATALLFALLGAPFLAALEVIIYAGAIMVMFLFMLTTLQLEAREKRQGSLLRPWLPAVVLGAISLLLIAVLLWTGSGHGLLLKLAVASPKELGRYLFEEFWFSVEAASFLLFVALVGALYLGRERDQEKRKALPAEKAP